MNIREINPDADGSLAHYFETAIPLTFVTIWIIIAFQGKWKSNDRGTNKWALLTQLWWPVIAARELFGKPDKGEGDNKIEMQNDIGSRHVV
jgi:hypothetical protein